MAKPLPKGRPMHVPTAQNRMVVKMAVAGGIEQIHIAAALDISRPTLRKHYKSELKTGPVSANVQVVAALFKSAVAGDVKAQVWWTQSRMGWSETQKIETTGPDGRPIEQLITYRWAEAKGE